MLSNVNCSKVVKAGPNTPVLPPLCRSPGPFTLPHVRRSRLQRHPRYLFNLQDRLCPTLAGEDGATGFREDLRQRPDGDGRTCIPTEGAVYKNEVAFARAKVARFSVSFFGASVELITQRTATSPLRRMPPPHKQIPPALQPHDCE